MKHDDGADITMQISATVEQLMKRSETYAMLGAAIGLSAQTIGRKMRGEREWTANEIHRLATYFGVSESALYAGPEALFAGAGRRITDAPDPHDRGTTRRYSDDSAVSTLAAVA